MATLWANQFKVGGRLLWELCLILFCPGLVLQASKQRLRKMDKRCILELQEFLNPLTVQCFVLRHGAY